MLRIIKYAFLVFLSLFFLACQSHHQLKPIGPNGVILAFGDSLTFGTGTDSAHSYPSVLAKLIQRKVINAGSPGELAYGGVTRLPYYLKKDKPQLVILCLGGNDMIKKRNPKKIEQDLSQMIIAIQETGADVVLLSVPKPGLFLSAAPFYKALGEKYNIPVENKLLPELLSENQYKSDAIHLNAKGYRLLAEGIAELLAQQGAIR